MQIYDLTKKMFFQTIQTLTVLTSWKVNNSGSLPKRAAFLEIDWQLGDQREHKCQAQVMWRSSKGQSEVREGMIKVGLS